ncbi:hypothetical protein ACMGDM_07925 [Sphingomonas sp. DT-51]|uniref:hypothetical protein n=1 Tax=Sphingomonas sp. DT-51 TaxID=3396165 RepID=UPI003F1C75E7
MLFWLLAITLIGFLLCMFLIDTVQVLLRATAAIVGAPVLGAHLGSVFMLVNRAATALSLLLIGYLVDSYVAKLDLMVIYAAAALLIALCHLTLSRRVALLRLMLFFFRRIYGKTPAPALIDAAVATLTRTPQSSISAAVVAVTSIGFLGLLVPSLLASTYPAYRATLMQTGFIINSLASVGSVLHVERVIAVTIDKGDPDDVNALYSSYSRSRLCGYMTAFALFAISIALASLASGGR